MTPTAPDALDQMKKAFKGLFGKKKAKKEESPSATATEQPSTSNAKPTETTPAAPVPAAAPEPAKSEGTTAPAGSAPAAQPDSAPVAVPSVAPAQDESKKDEAAALAEVKQATQSRSTSLLPLETREHGDDGCWDGSRRRQKVALDSDWNSPL